MKIEKPGLDLIKEFEGMILHPYKCPAGVSTIGIGTTRYNDGTQVKMSDPAITEDEAINMLEYQIEHSYGKSVNDLVTVDITQNQFDALCSFTYNLGAGNLKTSTLLKKVNTKDFKGAADEFLKWTRAGGKKLAGLVRRREEERELFLA